jgi:phage repressor protein C with HTH and peptisase S24 domain
MDVRQARVNNLNVLLGRYETLHEFAEKTGNNPSYISQIRNGVRRMGDDIARRIEHHLGLERGWMDQPHELPSEPREAHAQIITWTSPDDLPGHSYVLIRRRRVRCSAGNGGMVFEEEETAPLAFCADWIRRVGLRATDAVVVYASGDSMEPAIRDGDILLVDLARAEVTDGHVFALRYADDLRVKRLFRRYDGGLILRSDNQARYPDEVIPPEHQDGHVHVIGRVIWRAGEL